MKILVTTLWMSLSLVVADEAAFQEFTTGNNLFAGAIYREVQKESEGNFLISPFSVQTVLALTQSGAKEDTALEIRNGLNLPNSTEATESVYAAFLPILRGNKQYILHTANKIYVKTGFDLNENYKNLAASIYQAGVESIDFAQKTDAANSINRWVEQETEDKIHELIEPKNLDEDTRIILINALYFKGKWVNPFESLSTAKKDFYRTAEDVIQVDTMHTSELFNYYESSELNAKFLELPYQGDDASMVIVLPNDKEGLSTLESQIERVFSAPNFTQERVSVSLPKFTIESKLILKPILEKLGLKKVFTEEADLSGIAGRKGDLLVNDVIQKTFINVTESGTEAAAATAVQAVRHSIARSFIVDRPFIYYITTKKIVLFGGRVANPNLK